MKTRKTGRVVLQKAYVLVMIVLLLGVLAVRNERILGSPLFVEKTATEKPAAEFSLEDIQRIFPEASAYIDSEGRIEVQSDNETIGWAFNSSPYSDSIMGFASSVPVLLGFSMDDHLQGITMLKNYESPDFVENMVSTGFLDLWNGLHVLEIADADVDAVTGVTMTSSAIIKSMKISSGRILNEDVSLKEKAGFWSVLKMVLGYVLIAMALVQFFFPKRIKKIRTAYQIAIIVILGFWSGTFLSTFSFYNWTINGFDLPAKLFVLIVLVLSIILPLVTNKSFYCTHVCPFGASQDVLGKLNKSKLTLSLKTKKFLSGLQEKIFAVIMLLLFTGVSFDLTNVEPFSAFLFRTASIPVIVLAVSFLILSVFIPRPWCKYACPTGYVLETIRKPFKNK